MEKRNETATDSTPQSNASLDFTISSFLSFDRLCPWCRSNLPREVRGACPVCERSLVDGEGRELREVDLVYDRVVAVQRERLKRFLIVGTPIAAVVSLAGPLIHSSLAFFISVPLFVIAHAIALRVVLVAEPQRLLSRRRRFFTRNIGRWTFVLLSAGGYTLTAIPLAGALVGAATFAGVTSITFAHLMWSLSQERNREPLLLIEKIALAVVIVLVLGIVATVIAFGLVVGWGASKMMN